MNVVPFLFGCKSASLDQLGGRVEMSALSYSYFIAGRYSALLYFVFCLSSKNFSLYAIFLMSPSFSVI